MAIVAKVYKETKKFQHLYRIYGKDTKKIKLRKNAKKSGNPSQSFTKETTKKLTAKELINDVIIILSVTTFAFVGYVIARFINF